MNNKRRQRLEAINASLTNLIASLEEEKSKIEDVLDEETECKDNIPENLQGSERYENAEAACDALESAIICIEDAIENIEDARM
jgi:hypothetical protein